MPFAFASNTMTAEQEDDNQQTKDDYSHDRSYKEIFSYAELVHNS
jgi:hypothetical protein